jgi:hypothetical protein
MCVNPQYLLSGYLDRFIDFECANNQCGCSFKLKSQNYSGDVEIIEASQKYEESLKKAQAYK